MTIDVRSGGSDFIFDLAADDPEHGRTLFRRARAFVSADASRR